jgi:SAM-dependent methyltransferase
MPFLDVIRVVHNKLVFQRRKMALVKSLSDILPARPEVLDVGSGDGSIGRLISEQVDGARVQGVDIFVRPNVEIAVTEFDGKRLPFPDDSFDVVSFVDVLHHTDNPFELLAEAKRVARHHIIIKDHHAENSFDRLTLSFMDWIGNAPQGVVLPYNYDNRQTWEDRWARLDLLPEIITKDIPLYPWPFSLVFGRSLHFIVRLRSNDEKEQNAQQEN